LRQILGGYLGKSIGLLVVGPVQASTVETIELNMRLFSEVQLATWPPKNSEESLLLAKLVGIAGVSIVSLDSNELEGYSNLPFQVATTRAGLEAMNSDIVVRCRSDEFYDLKPFTEVIFKNPDKIWSSNFIVRPWSYHPFHISDHLFAAELGLLKTAFSFLSGPESFNLSRILGPRHMMVPESRIGLALFNAALGGDFASGWFAVNAASSKTTFDLFAERFRLFDLDSEQGSRYRVNANNAGIIGSTSLPKLGSVLSNAGAPIDFVHVRELRQLAPRSNLIEWIFLRWRYLLRTYVAPWINPK